MRDSLIAGVSTAALISPRSAHAGLDFCLAADRVSGMVTKREGITS